MQHYKHDSNYFNNIKTVNFILYYIHSAAAGEIHILFTFLHCLVSWLTSYNA